MTATERVQREVDIFFQGYWEGVRTMKEQNKIVKVCELKIDNHTDTADLVAILARAGYRVSIKNETLSKRSGYTIRYFYVVVEGEEK